MTNENVFVQIESVCRDFRRQCRAGDKPRIEDFLSGVDQSACVNLFRNLVNIEIEFRRRGKLNPTADEYIQRFPKFARLIRQQFFVSTMASLEQLIGTSMTRSVEAADDDQTMSFEVPAANQLGDYCLLRELGRGGFGVVYEARHTQRHNHVALKTLPLGQDHHRLGDAERLHKFRREFRSLADVNHPNLVGMQTLEVDGSQWFFTMDLVDGEDFFSYVRPDERLDEARLRAVLPQLANGIMALHGQHIIHRDLKPSNVMVDAEGKVKVLDFGLVVEITQSADQTHSIQSLRFAGTPMYAAPEQIVGQSTAASDWYALGVILYEALSGERPFTGTVAEVLRKKQTEDPDKLSRRADLPQDLVELVDNLLMRDPAQRADALEVAKALSLETTSRTIINTDEQEAEQIADGGQLLIGREQQLAALKALKQRLLSQRQPLVVFITGRSGEGKTSLAEKFVQPLRRGTEVLVLSGRCYDRETVPFKAVDSIIDSLVAFLRGRSPEHLAEWLPKDTRMLAHLFPVLGRVDPIAELMKQPIGQLDSKQIRYRAFNALGELLKNVGESVPVVMFIDDLQWGDADGAAVLFQLLTSNVPPALLFVGSYRRDEADESPFLKEWDKLKAEQRRELFQPNIAVGPLSESQCVALVIARLAIDSQPIRSAASDIFRSTGGNPYFLDQLIDCYDPETRSFRAVPLGEVIKRKLSKLSADALPLLKTIAVSGRALGVAEASQATGQGTAVYATLTHMRNERLVRLVGSQDREQVDTYHDKIRETVLDQLEPNERRGLHLTLGETIEKRQSIDGNAILHQLSDGDAQVCIPVYVFDLAYHFEQAGETDKSLAYSILAAEQAAAQFALPNAIDHYQAAEAKLDRANNAIRYRVKYGLGSVLLLAGQYEASNLKLSEAVAVAGNKIEVIQAKSQQADFIYKTGSLRDSIAACEAMLHELGLPVPRSKLGKALGIYRSRILWLVHKLFARRLSGNQVTDDRIKRLAITVLSQYAYPCLFCDRASSIWATSIANHLARTIGDKSLIARAAAFLILSTSWFRGDYRKADRIALDALNRANELNDVNCRALVLLHQAANNMIFGRSKDAIEQNRKAIEQFGLIGDVWRKTFGQGNQATIQLRLGNLAVAQSIAREVFCAAIQFGQHRLATYSLSSWIDSTDERLPMSELLGTFKLVPDDLMIHSWFRTSQGRWYLKNGQTAEALQVAKFAIQDAVHHSYSMGGPSESFPVYAHALRAHAEAINATKPLEAEKLRRQAIVASKKAVRINRISTYALPYALRELALNYLHGGKFRKALKHISESCLVALRQEAKYEYAQSLLVCGQVGEKLGLPEAQQQIAEAEEKLDGFRKQMQSAAQIGSSRE